MDQPCHKCGAAVPEGIPFCRQCGAPQIRVVGAEPQVGSASGSTNQEDAVVAPALPFPEVSVAARVRWSQALPGAALGGVFSLLAAVIPFAIFGPAFMLGGALAVRLYRRHLKGGVPSVRAGAQVGAASGGFGLLFLAIPFVATLVYRPDELRQAVLTQLSMRGYDQQQVQQVQELLKTHDGLIAFVVMGMLVLLFVIVAGGCIGGALYAAWLRKRISL